MMPVSELLKTPIPGSELKTKTLKIGQQIKNVTQMYYFDLDNNTYRIAITRQIKHRNKLPPIPFKEKLEYFTVLIITLAKNDSYEDVFIKKRPTDIQNVLKIYSTILELLSKHIKENPDYIISFEISKSRKELESFYKKLLDRFMPENKYRLFISKESNSKYFLLVPRYLLNKEESLNKKKITYIEQSMNTNILLERTLYHGTIIDNVPKIKELGLIPSVGDFIKNMYKGSIDDESQLEKLVFASDKKGLQGVLSAIVGHIANKLGKDFQDVTDEEIIKHGAVVKIKEEKNKFKQVPRDDDQTDTTEHPIGAEGGDYYSKEEVLVDEILTGDAMIRLFKRYGLWPRTFGPNKLAGMRNALIRAAIKRNPDYPHEKIATVINKKLSDKEVEELYHQLPYGER